MARDQALAGAGGVISLEYGVRQARNLGLTTQELSLAGLPPQVCGRRVLHITDGHLSPPSHLARRIIHLAHSASPDWIFVTGDMFLGAHGPRATATFLSQLAGIAPTFVVTGNADYCSSAAPEPGRAYFGAAQGLLNRAQLLADGNHPCWIAGVSDPHVGRDRLEEALDGVPQDAWIIVLAHSPDIILRPLSRRARLIFAGHTHGGQVCLPGFGALYTRTRVSRRYASGVHQLGNTTLVVSRGAGTTRLPIRIFCPAEMTLWCLTRKEEGAGSPDPATTRLQERPRPNWRASGEL